MPPAATDLVRLVNIGHTLSNVELGVVLKMPKMGTKPTPTQATRVGPYEVGQIPMKKINRVITPLKGRVKITPVITHFC